MSCPPANNDTSTPKAVPAESGGSKGTLIKLAIDKLKESKKSDDDSKSMPGEGEVREDRPPKSKAENRPEASGEKSKERDRGTKSRERDRGRDSDREREREESDRDRDKVKDRSHRSKDKGKESGQ